MKQMAKWEIVPCPENLERHLLGESGRINTRAPKGRREKSTRQGVNSRGYVAEEMGEAENPLYIL